MAAALACPAPLARPSHSPPPRPPPPYFLTIRPPHTLRMKIVAAYLLLGLKGDAPDKAAVKAFLDY